MKVKAPEGYHWMKNGKGYKLMKTYQIHVGGGFEAKMTQKQTNIIKTNKVLK